MAQANIEVIRIMGWGDFDGTSAVFSVDVAVGNDRDFFVGQWQ